MTTFYLLQLSCPVCGTSVSLSCNFYCKGPLIHLGTRIDTFSRNISHNVGSKLTLLRTPKSEDPAKVARPNLVLLHEGLVKVALYLECN